MQKERYEGQKHQNFGTIYHTEVFLTFLRLAAKLSEASKKFQGCSLKIKPPKSFHLNDLKKPLLNILKVASNKCICFKD